MFEVLEATGLATLQDSGRLGWRRFGVPLAGPMDRFAYNAANLLAGNPPGYTVIELGMGDLLLRTTFDCVIAVTGAGYQLSVNDWVFPMWGSYFLRGGWAVRLSRSGFGMWAYISLAGGFDIPPLLGSHSTYPRGRFGGLDGRSLQPGDQLKISDTPHTLMETAARVLPEDARPAYSASPTLDVIPGPQSDRFASGDLSRFFSTPYRLSSSSDRMGYRLEGAALPVASPDLISEGMTIGSIQVPADGQPIVMMSDCATTGGYPKIACVTSAALPLLAQCTPGADEVRFRQVTVESAQAAYRALMQHLPQGIMDAEDWKAGG
jgi:antagonist of KipI